MGAPEPRLRISAAKGDQLQTVTDVEYHVSGEYEPLTPPWVHRIESLLAAGCSVTLLIVSNVTGRTNTRQ